MPKFMIRRANQVTDLVDNEFVCLAAWLLAFTGIVLGTGQLTGSGAINADGLQYALPAGFGLAIFATFATVVWVPNFGGFVGLTVGLGALGFANEKNPAFPNLQLAHAFYALAAFTLFYGVWAWLNEWDEYDNDNERAVHAAYLSLLGAIAGIPVIYGIGWAPIVAVAAFYAFCAWWGHVGYCAWKRWKYEPADRRFDLFLSLVGVIVIPITYTAGNLIVAIAVPLLVAVIVGTVYGPKATGQTATA